MPRQGYRKPAEERQNRRIEIRLTEADFQHISQAADKAGLTVAAYVRLAALGARPKAKLSQVNSEAVRQLIAVGNNLNQLARQANAGQFPAQRLLENALARLTEILGKLA